MRNISNIFHINLTLYHSTSLIGFEIPYYSQMQNVRLMNTHTPSHNVNSFEELWCIWNFPRKENFCENSDLNYLTECGSYGCLWLKLVWFWCGQSFRATLCSNKQPNGWKLRPCVVSQAWDAVKNVSTLRWIWKRTCKVLEFSSHKHT